jgi:hypothetical protein
MLSFVAEAQLRAADKPGHACTTVERRIDGQTAHWREAKPLKKKKKETMTISFAESVRP